ncbi:MAG: HNH endonuclease [Thermoplasmata archaeon]
MGNAWRLAHLSESNANARRWRRENRERTRAYNRRYRQTHPGWNAAIMRRHYRDNPAASVENAVAWARAHPERKRETRKRWRQAHPEWVASRTRRLTLPWLLRKCPDLQPICAIGGGVAHHADHIIPKSRGGSDSPSNLRPLCRRHNLMRGPGRLSDLQLQHTPCGFEL